MYVHKKCCRGPRGYKGKTGPTGATGPVGPTGGEFLRCLELIGLPGGITLVRS